MKNWKEGSVGKDGKRKTRLRPAEEDDEFDWREALEKAKEETTEETEEENIGKILDDFETEE